MSSPFSDLLKPLLFLDATVISHVEHVLQTIQEHAPQLFRNIRVLPDYDGEAILYFFGGVRKNTGWQLQSGIFIGIEEASLYLRDTDQTGSVIELVQCSEAGFLAAVQQISIFMGSVDTAAPVV
jgi:hypothetical protein